MGRLKNLDYLNLALNNIERVENLEGKYPLIFCWIFVPQLKQELCKTNDIENRALDSELWVANGEQ